MKDTRQVQEALARAKKELMAAERLAEDLGLPKTLIKQIGNLAGRTEHLQHHKRFNP